MGAQIELREQHTVPLQQTTLLSLPISDLDWESQGLKQVRTTRIILLL